MSLLTNVKEMVMAMDLHWRPSQVAITFVTAEWMHVNGVSRRALASVRKLLGNNWNFLTTFYDTFHLHDSVWCSSQAFRAVYTWRGIGSHPFVVKNDRAEVRKDFESIWYWAAAIHVIRNGGWVYTHLLSIPSFIMMCLFKHFKFHNELNFKD